MPYQIGKWPITGILLRTILNRQTPNHYAKLRWTPTSLSLTWRICQGGPACQLLYEIISLRNHQASQSFIHRPASIPSHPYAALSTRTRTLPPPGDSSSTASHKHSSTHPHLTLPDPLRHTYGRFRIMGKGKFLVWKTQFLSQIKSFQRF